MANLPGMNSL